MRPWLHLAFSSITIASPVKESMLQDAEPEPATRFEEIQDDEDGDTGGGHVLISIAKDDEPETTNDKADKASKPAKPLPDGTTSLHSGLTSVVGSIVEETFLCMVCFENKPLSFGTKLTACGHYFCADCFRRYLELKINDGQVYPTCFHVVVRSRSRRGPQCVGACNVAVDPADIKALVASIVWQRYETFKLSKENAGARSCPQCGTSAVFKGIEQPECECAQCGLVFCFTHGNAHVNRGSCADYELEQRETQRLSRDAIATLTKPCPGCTINVQKHGGCNHMTCTMCGTHFCWLCTKKMKPSAVRTHYEWWNVSGCGGKLLDYNISNSACDRFLLFLMRFVFFVICRPIAIALTLVFTVLSCFWLPFLKKWDMSFGQVVIWSIQSTTDVIYKALHCLGVFIFSVVIAAVSCALGILCCCCGGCQIGGGTEQHTTQWTSSSTTVSYGNGYSRTTTSTTYY